MYIFGIQILFAIKLYLITELMKLQNILYNIYNVKIIVFYGSKCSSTSVSQCIIFCTGLQETLGRNNLSIFNLCIAQSITHVKNFRNINLIVIHPGYKIE